MTRRHAISVGAVFALLGLVMVLATCSGAATPAEVGASQDLTGQTTRVAVGGGGSYTDVSVAGLAAMLQNKDFPLINVHIPYEGEIEGTDLFIPYDEIDRHVDQLPADKDARIVLYCRSDRMGGIAANTLVGLGYTDVWNLDGGMVAWQVAGKPLLNHERK